MSDIERVALKGDPAWDGAVAAVAIGGVIASLPFESPSCAGRCFSQTPAGKVLGVLIVGGLGAWWDAKHSDNEVIYESP